MTLAARRLCCLLALVCLAPASALAARCVVGSSVYYSDKPCPAPAGNALVQYGPTPERKSYSRSPRPPQRAPEHVQYLSPECADLNDAIRTAPSRGAGRDVISDLRYEYDRKCKLEDRAARKKSSRAARDEERERVNAERTAEAQANSAKLRQDDRCTGMADIIRVRRDRIDTLKEPELASLQRLETSYRSQCLSAR